MGVKLLSKSAGTVITAVILSLGAGAGAQTPDDGWYTGNSAAETFYISNADELAGLARLVNDGNDFAGKTILLTDDIDLSGYGRDMIHDDVLIGWMPIGRVTPSQNIVVPPTDNPFRGTFDGGGKKISGLYIHTAPDKGFHFAGLFSVVGSGGVIKNVGIENADINGRFNTVGVLAAIAGIGSSITSCYTTGTLSAVTEAGGGLVGTLRGRLTDSYSAVAVNILSGGFGGGLAGRLDGLPDHFVDPPGKSNKGAKIESCYSIGTVSADAFVFIGGLIGSVTVDPADPYIAALNNAALNPSVTGTHDIWRGRVLSVEDYTFRVLQNNVAFSGMEGGFTGDTGADTKNGADITIAEIHADGTIGGLFTNTDVWTIEPGKLPGLFGKAADMPPHLSYTTSVSRPASNKPANAAKPRISVRNNTLTVSASSGAVSAVNLIDLRGKTVARFRTGVSGAGAFSLANIPSGRYLAEVKRGGRRVGMSSVVVR